MAARAPSGIAVLVRPGRVEASLWRRFRFEEDAECREALFNLHAHLAKSIAARHFFRRVVKRIDRADFEQFAFEGLLQAIDRYDPLKGIPFSAFARRRIAGSIADGVSRMSEIDAQISHRRRMEQERLRSLCDAGEQDDPLSALADLAAGLALGFMLEGTSLMEPQDGRDHRPTAYESLEWRELQSRITRELANLPGKEGIVVRHHYEMGLSFTQIADLLQLSRGRISQLHRSALDRLRRRIGTFA